MVINFNSSVLIGRNILSHQIKLLKGKKIVLVISPTPDNLFGVLFKNILLKKIIITNNNLKEIKKLANKKELKDCEIIVGFGAGTCLDIAKTLAHLNSKYLIAIPSVLSCNVFATNKSVITQNKKAKTIDSKIPDKIIIELELFKKTNERFIFSGLADALSIYTALYDWELAIKSKKEKEDKLIMNFARSILYSVLENYSHFFNINEQTIQELSKVLLLSGYITNIYGSGRPESGSEHMFSRAIEESGLYNKKILHGETVMLGILLCSELQKRSDKRLYDIAARMSLISTLNRLNLDRKKIADLLLTASTIRLERYSIYNKVHLNKGKSLRIANKVMNKLENDK